MTERSQRPIVVVGGGASGLNAALTLCAAGEPVILFERRTAVGGMGASFTLDCGARLDRYYHYFSGIDAELIRLARTLLPAEDGLRWRAAPVGMRFEGRLQPFSSVFDILRFASVDPPSRLRVCAHTAYSAVLRDHNHLDEITAAEWLTAWLGPRAYHVIWEPLMRRKFGVRADAVAASWIWSRIRRMAASRPHGVSLRRFYGYIDGGVHRLVDRMVARARALGAHIRCDTSVTGIETDGQRVTGVAWRNDGTGRAGRVAHPRAVLSTLPLPVLRDLVQGPLPSDWPPVVDYLPVTVLVVLLDRPLTEFFWLNTNDPEFGIAGIIEYSNLDRSLAAKGLHVLYVPFYADDDQTVTGASADRLLDRVAPDLKRVNPAFDRAWVRENHVFADTHGQSVMSVDTPALFARGTTPIINLWVTDSCHLLPHDRSIDGSLTMGTAVARRLLAGRPEVTEPTVAPPRTPTRRS